MKWVHRCIIKLGIIRKNMWNEFNYERVVNNLMNEQYFENIIKLKNINTNEMSDDVSIMLIWLRLSKE